MCSISNGYYIVALWYSCNRNEILLFGYDLSISLQQLLMRHSWRCKHCQLFVTVTIDIQHPQTWWWRDAMNSATGGNVTLFDGAMLKPFISRLSFCRFFLPPEPEKESSVPPFIWYTLLSYIFSYISLKNTKNAPNVCLVQRTLIIYVNFRLGKDHLWPSSWFGWLCNTYVILRITFVIDVGLNISWRHFYDNANGMFSECLYVVSFSDIKLNGLSSRVIK